MTRLINFGLGEVCDRLSLLALRILYSELAGHDPADERRERAALLPKIFARTNGRWLECWSELNAVHAALWLYEADLREYKAATAASAQLRAGRSDEIIECAFRIQELYDRRTTLITQINSLVGDKVTTATPETPAVN